MSYAVNYLPPDRTLALYEECAVRARDAKAAIESGEPPKPEYPAGHKICRQCEFRGVCGNADESEAASGELSDDMIARLARESVSNESTKAQKARAKAALKAHMTALGKGRIDVSVDGANYSLTCSLIRKWDVDMDKLNSVVDPKARDEFVRERITRQFRISGPRDV